MAHSRMAIRLTLRCFRLTPGWSALCDGAGFDFAAEESPIWIGSKSELANIESDFECNRA